MFRDDLAILAVGGGQLFIRACFNLPTLGDLYRIATYKALLERRRKESEVFEDNCGPCLLSSGIGMIVRFRSSDRIGRAARGRGHRLASESDTAVGYEAPSVRIFD